MYASIPDGAGGTIVAWGDPRGSDTDIYAQRVNSSGVPQWTSNGVAVSTASGNQTECTLVSEGSAGAVICWQDYRSGTNQDLYAQRVFSDGALPVTLSSFTAAASDGEVMLRWVTESEIENLGFHVYRAFSEDGEYERLTTDVIAGAGTSTGRREYAFTDIRLTNGVTTGTRSRTWPSTARGRCTGQ